MTTITQHLLDGQRYGQRSPMLERGDKGWVETESMALVLSALAIVWPTFGRHINPCTFKVANNDKCPSRGLRGRLTQHALQARGLMRESSPVTPTMHLLVLCPDTCPNCVMAFNCCCLLVCQVETVCCLMNLMPMMPIGKSAAVSL